MEKILSRITEIVTEYKDLTIPTAMAVSNLHKQLASELFFLAGYRNDYHTLHNKHIQQSSKSVARATVDANDKYQELYKFRQIMKYADGVIQAMRSEISTINREK